MRVLRKIATFAYTVQNPETHKKYLVFRNHGTEYVMSEESDVMEELQGPEREEVLNKTDFSQTPDLTLNTDPFANEL